MQNKKIAFFAGTFDPFTIGHEYIVNKGLELFDEVVIGIGSNPDKHRVFSEDKMILKIKETFKTSQAVSVISFHDLTALEAQRHGAKILIRGLRNAIDFSYEQNISLANKKINSDLETVFITTTPELMAISSSLIRELHKYEQPYQHLLPYNNNNL